jgi:hypothetical protein
MSHDPSSFEVIVYVLCHLFLASPAAALLFELQQLKIMLQICVNCVRGCSGSTAAHQETQKYQVSHKGLQGVTARGGISLKVAVGLCVSSVCAAWCGMPVLGGQSITDLKLRISCTTRPGRQLVQVDPDSQFAAFDAGRLCIAV